MVEITLEYRPEMIQYKATIKNNCFYHEDPIEAIKAALENHNYSVHEEMYEVLKIIAETAPMGKIHDVIRRYEDDNN